MKSKTTITTVANPANLATYMAAISKISKISRGHVYGNGFKLLLILVLLWLR